MAAFWNAMSPYGWVDPIASQSHPPGILDEQGRLDAQARIEAIVARDLFGLGRDDLAYVMDTFPIVKRRDEQAYGDFRTKRVILEMYDALQRLADADEPCQARLGPSSTDPRAGI
jgi:hypothetical protein